MPNYILDENDQPKKVTWEEWAAWYFPNKDRYIFGPDEVKAQGKVRAVVVTRFDGNLKEEHMHGDTPLCFVTEVVGEEKFGSRVVNRQKAMQNHLHALALQTKIYQEQYPDRRKSRLRRSIIALLRRLEQ